MKVILDTNAIQNIKVFQTISPVNVLDCIENDEAIYFVVKSDSRHNARIGQNIRRMESIFKKRIRVFEFSSDPRIFMKRMVPEAMEIEIDGAIAKIKVKNCFKPKVIGKEKKNLIVIKSFLKRFFEIEDLKII